VKIEITKETLTSKKFMVTAGVILFIIVSVIGLMMYQKQQQVQAEEKAKQEQKEKEQEYLAQLEDAHLTITDAAAKAEEMSSTYVDAWHDAIWNDYVLIDGVEMPVSDFDEGIMFIYLDFEANGDITALTDEAFEIDLLLKDLNNPPEKYQKFYDMLIDIQLNYETYVDLAEYPSGSFETYSKNVNDLSNDLYKQLKEFELRLPDAEDEELELNMDEL
jgi:hypothetical protein